MFNEPGTVRSGMIPCRSAADVPPAPSLPRTINEDLEQLLSQVDRLKMNANALVTSIAPVLRPDEPRPVSNDHKFPVGASQMSAIVGDLTESVAGLADLLAQTGNRVAL